MIDKCGSVYDDFSLLHYACEKPSLDIMEYIIDSEYKPNVSELTKVVSCACEHGHFDILKSALKINPDLLRECTPLYYAGNDRIMQYLIQQVPHCQLSYPQRAKFLFLALEHGQVDIAKHIIKANVYDPDGVMGYRSTPLHLSLIHI